MSGFAFTTIGELADGYRHRAFSPTEVLADVIRRLEVIEPTLNMFAHLDLTGARAQALAAEDRMMRGGLLGPLDGIPTSVKDLIAVAGMPQRSGSRTTSAAPVARNAPSVARIRAAGAVILGKSTTSEFGCKGVGDSPLTGITRNPWDPSKTPGGSSAGAAAMVACGLVPYALGTDGGGSLRIPAALTGLYGIKSQFGRVAVFPTSATPTLAHVGPLTRTAADAAEVLSVIAGYDARDPFSVAGPGPNFRAALGHGPRLRIAFSPTLGYGRVDPEVAAITARSVQALQVAGHHVEQIDHCFDDPIDMWTAEFYAGVAIRLRASLEDEPDVLDPAVLRVLKAAVAQDLRTYYESVFHRYEFREKVRQMMEPYDLLVTPTIPVASLDVGVDIPLTVADRTIVSWATFTYPFNLTGQPAASLPVGMTAAGMPVGLQVVTKALGEATILSIAAENDRRLGGSAPHPMQAGYLWSAPDMSARRRAEHALTLERLRLSASLGYDQAQIDTLIKDETVSQSWSREYLPSWARRPANWASCEPANCSDLRSAKRHNAVLIGCIRGTQSAIAFGFTRICRLFRTRSLVRLWPSPIGQIARDFRSAAFPVRSIIV